MTPAEVAAAFARRRDVVAALGDDAPALALLCRDVADRFGRGGRLLALGTGACATDAQHVAVEMVHPVVVGKRALPALSLVPDTGVVAREGLAAACAHQVDVLGRPDDVLLVLAGDDGASVRDALAVAGKAGLLTVALTGADAEVNAQHVLAVGSSDPLVVKEAHVTLYHLLWELVHVFLEVPPDDGLSPYLQSGSAESLLGAVAESARQKVAEVVALRADLAQELAAPLAACGREIASALTAGGTLLAFGNGGSSTDAQQLVRTFLDPPAPARPRAALCLTAEPAVVTALTNDVGVDVLFARQVEALGRPGDVAVGLSTSGGSANVVAGLQAAADRGLVTVALAGYGGGRLADLPAVQHLLAVPSTSVHRVQELQTTLYHLLWEASAD